MTKVVKKKKHVLEGVVTSDKMSKTRTVEITKVLQHAEYKKFITRQIKCYAHDEANVSKLGDRVRIVETGPVSKTKRWRIAEVVTA